MFRMKGYESSAAVPLLLQQGRIEIRSGGVDVDLSVGQTEGGKGQLVVTKDGKRYFAAEVEEFAFGLTLDQKGDAFQLTNSFVFTPSDEGVQFVPILGGGAKGKQKIMTMVQKEADTNGRSPMEVITATLEGVPAEEGAPSVFAGARYANGKTDLYASKGMMVIAPGQKIHVEGERPLYVHYGSNGDFELDSGGRVRVEFLNDKQQKEYDDFLQQRRKTWTSSLLSIRDANLRGNIKELNKQYEKAFAELKHAQEEEREILDRISAIEKGKANSGLNEDIGSMRNRLKELREKNIPLHAKQIWEASRGLHGALAIAGAKAESDADVASLVLLDNLKPHLYVGEIPSGEWFVPEHPILHTEKEPVFAQKDIDTSVFGTLGYITSSITKTGEFLTEDQWGLRRVEGGGYGTRPPAFSSEDIAVRFIRGMLPSEQQKMVGQQLYEPEFSPFSARNMNQQSYRAIEQALRSQLQKDRRLVGLSDAARDALIQYVEDTLKYYRTGNVDSYEAERELRKWDNKDHPQNRPSAEKKRKK